MAGKETFKEVQPTNADATKKMQPILVTGNERDYFCHIQPYLGSSVYDSSIYDSIAVEVNGEVQRCLDTPHPSEPWETIRCIQGFTVFILSQQHACESALQP